MHSGDWRYIRRGGGAADGHPCSVSGAGYSAGWFPTLTTAPFSAVCIATHNPAAARFPASAPSRTTASTPSSTWDAATGAPSSRPPLFADAGSPPSSPRSVGCRPPSQPSTSSPMTEQQPASSPLVRGPMLPPGRGMPRQVRVRPGLLHLPLPATPLPLQGAWVAGPPVFPSSPIAQADDPVAQADDDDGWQVVVRGGRPPNEEEISRMMWEEELTLQLNVINRDRISKEFFNKCKKK